jgi:cathepsin E
LAPPAPPPTPPHPSPPILTPPLFSSVYSRLSSYQYYGTFELGSPPVKYTGCFDTGSADTWLPAGACANPSCLTHTRFEPRSSSTYQTLNAPFQITYGTGSVAGFVGSDVLTLGDTPGGPKLSVVNQGFGIVFDSSMDFLSASCDGLFGLAFPELSEMQVNPAFFNMMRQEVLDEDIFGLWLSADPAQEPAGVLTFGAADKAHYHGELEWVPVSEKAYWTVPMSGGSVGSTALPLAAKAAILDSGTTAILMSDADAARLHRAIPGVAFNPAGGYYNITGGCAAVPSLPDIGFTLGGTTYTIPPRLWTQQVPNPAGGINCISGIIPGGDSNSIILGDNFLRAWYTAYKYDRATHTASVGFALPKDVELEAPSPEIQAVTVESASAAAASRDGLLSSAASTGGSGSDAPQHRGRDWFPAMRPFRLGPIEIVPGSSRYDLAPKPQHALNSEDAMSAP